MSADTPAKTGASVRARLKRRADALGLAFDQALQYYAIERFLFRLSQTQWADALVIKGAAMLRVWEGAVARPTRDIDFLGRLDNSPETVERMVRECIGIVTDDGLEFSREVTVTRITVEDRYPGARAVVRAELSGARITLRLDIGIGDAVVPDPGWIDYPSLLDLESPRILAYRPATAVAEKFQTMIEKGLLNSRVKDYYDVWMLSRSVQFDGEELREAIRATFERRGTAVPSVRPPEVSNEYTSQSVTRAQWTSFARQMRASGVETPPDMSLVMEQVAEFVVPVSRAAAAGEPFRRTWDAERGWL